MEPEQVFSEYTPLSDGNSEAFKFCPACGSRLALETVAGRSRLRCSSCRYVHFRNPTPGAVVLVVDGDRFLLCRRRPPSRWGGKWCLPGGVVEWDEDFITAGIREVREETGLDVEIESILTVTSNFFDTTTHTLATVLLAKVIAGTPKGDDHETDPVRWFSPADELPDLAFEGDRHIIQRYFERPFDGAPVDPRFARHGPRGGGAGGG